MRTFKEIFDFRDRDDDFESPLEFFLFLIVGGASQYGIYWGITYILNIFNTVGNAYSLGGKLFSVLLFFVALMIVSVGVRTFPIFWWKIVRIIYLFLVSSPEIIRNETDIVRRIWQNRGFGKFRLFGGFLFYFRLRQRVIAYFLAFLSIGITTWYFAFKQHEYEKTYWKVHFYYGEPIPEIVFKPNVSYTFESSADLYAIYLNGTEHIVSKYMKLEENPRVLSLIFPEKWNVKFPDTMHVEFLFYADHINEIFSQSFEVWADKEEGLKLTYNDFIFERVKKVPRTKRYSRN
ncbi:MAG: hypothetical protein K8I03_01020 [Ignavibacteria bacterium]|nr:hypothetical protein [Ignavibacteria bacterium]